MDCIPKNSLLEFHPDTLEAVRKEYGLEKPGVMSAAIDELDSWVQQQKHFKKKDFSRHYLETVILSTKGSLEKAKKRLEQCCTMKTTMPQCFQNYDYRIDFKEIDGAMKQAVMPKLTKDHTRVFVARPCNFPTNFVSLSCRRMLTFCEYLRNHDYNDGVIVIIDYRDANLMSLITKIRIFELRRYLSILIDGYGTRVKAMHFLTESFIINFLLAIFKSVVSTKIGNRMNAHKDLESLHKVVDKDILPGEYGGKEPSLEILHESWVDELSSEEFCNYLREINSAGVDESLRQKEE